MTLPEDSRPDVRRCPRCGTYGTAAHRCAARTLPLLDDASGVRIVAPPPEPAPYVYPVRAEVRRVWDAKVDLERLAHPRWQRHFYGRGLEPRETVQVSGGERADPCDGRSMRERAEVTAIHAHLEALRTGDGRLHYAVLAFAFLTHGPEDRVRWDSFLEELGWAFATLKQRRAWSKMQLAERRAAPRLLATQLYDAAVAAYAEDT